MKKVRSHYKIRPLTIENNEIKAFGLNVPKDIAIRFQDIFFSVSIRNDGIFYSSGTCPFAKEETY